MKPGAGHSYNRNESAPSRDGDEHVSHRHRLTVNMRYPKHCFIV